MVFHVFRWTRERSPGLTDSDSLMESISTVINDSISAPVTMGKLATARHDYMQAQEKLRECKTVSCHLDGNHIPSEYNFFRCEMTILTSIAQMEQLGDLIPNRNKVRSVLTATVEAFLEETKSLPVRKRLEKLEVQEIGRAHV